MKSFSIETRKRKYYRGYGFLPFAKNLSNKHGKYLLDTATKIGLDALDTAFKRAVHKADKATDNFLGTKSL